MRALATTGDVEARLERPLDNDQTRAVSLLDEASLLLVGYLGYDPTGQDGAIPAAVTMACSRMVARVLSSASDLANVEHSQTTAGLYSESLTYTPGSTSGGPWLTASDKVMLKPFRSGVAVVERTSGQTGRYRSATL